MSNLPAYAPAINLSTGLVISHKNEHCKTALLSTPDGTPAFQILLSPKPLHMMIHSIQAWKKQGSGNPTFIECAPTVSITRIDSSPIAALTPFDFNDSMGYTIETTSSEQFKMLVESGKGLKGLAVKTICSFIGPNGSYHWRIEGTPIDITGLSGSDFTFMLFFTPFGGQECDSKASKAKKLDWKHLFLGHASSKVAIAKMTVNMKLLHLNGDVHPVRNGGVWESEEECAIVTASALVAQLGLRYRLFCRFLHGEGVYVSAMYGGRLVDLPQNSESFST
ncbi:UNVERIFIED_CONTAM: hypothetical protein HDU68_004952 [Siphonaria sp. JEL0065]|nr:hypothetical protein HDU68_004952 [Siphonaria sp. JEL0065]